MHDNDLHADIHLEMEDLLTGLQCLCPRVYKHVALPSERFKVIDEIAEFRAPAEDTELMAATRLSVMDTELRVISLPGHTVCISRRARWEHIALRK
jgi:hypothetical protein